MTATAAIIAGTRRAVVVHSVDPPVGARGPQQIGDQVDRAGGQRDAVGPGGARAARRARGAGSRTVRAGGPPSWPHSDCSVAGGSARGLALRGADDLVAQRQQLAQHRRRRPCRRGSRCRPPAAGRRGSRAAPRPARPCRPGCARRRGRVSGSSSTTSKRPGTSVEAAAAATAPLVQRARGRPRPRRARARSCAAGSARGRSSSTPGSAGAATSARAALGARARASASASGCRSAPTTSVPRRPHDVELLARDVGHRRARASACAPGRRWSAPARASGMTLVAS